jgi:hypothetical protein
MMYKKPSGEETPSVNEYVQAWQEFQTKIERVLDVQAIGFDPGVAVMQKGGRHSVTLPLWLALRIAKLQPPT